MSNIKIKHFPLTVTEDFLVDIGEVTVKGESKHEFFVEAARKEVERRKKEKGGQSDV